jgi:hypothetical protein
MDSSNKLTVVGLSCLGLIALAAIFVVISAFITTLVWGWIVPLVFSGAVEIGALPASLTLVQALKLSVLFSLLGLTGATTRSSSKRTTKLDGCGEYILYSVIAFAIFIPSWAIITVISGFLISIIWGWVVPDVFSGAVAMNLLPAQLSLWHAILLSFLFSVLGLSSHRASSKDKE